jgi:hypothetical protein
MGGTTLDRRELKMAPITAHYTAIPACIGQS